MHRNPLFPPQLKMVEGSAASFPPKSRPLQEARKASGFSDTDYLESHAVVCQRPTQFAELPWVISGALRYLSNEVIGRHHTFVTTPNNGPVGSRGLKTPWCCCMYIDAEDSADEALRSDVVWIRPSDHLGGQAIDLAVLESVIDEVRQGRAASMWLPYYNDCQSAANHILKEAARRTKNRHPHAE